MCEYVSDINCVCYLFIYFVIMLFVWIVMCEMCSYKYNINLYNLITRE